MAKKRGELDRHGYSLSPQDVSKTFWYYEDSKGLCCVFQPRDAKGNLLLHWPAWHIPWRLLDKTFERRQAAKKKRLLRRQSGNARC